MHQVVTLRDVNPIYVFLVGLAFVVGIWALVL